MQNEKVYLRFVREIADYQFGFGVGARLFPENCRVQLSKKTGRPRYIWLDDRLIATLRSLDGFLALTILGGERLASIVPRPRFRVTVAEDAVRYVLEGRNLLVKGVLEADSQLLPGEEVLLEDREGRLIAVGRAVLSGETMIEAERGVAVRVRQSRQSIKLNSPQSEVK